MIHITDICGINQIYSALYNLIMEKIVMMLKKLQLIFILVLSGFGLVACGDSDTGPAEKPKAMAPSEGISSSISSNASNGGLEAYDPDVPSMVVEDNGVISEEEIYSNWPQ